ncbi:MAG: ABC transporter permease, partial [Candidatus Aminicenantales bacterium]
MNYELFIAKRYLTAKRKQAFISLITFISALGITIGVMALIIAIALITGFQSDVQDKILSSTAHIMVSDLSGQGLEDYEQLIKKIKSIKGIISVSPVVYDTVLLKGPYKASGAVLKGLDFNLEKKHSPWLQKLERGSLPPPDIRRGGLLLGKEIALNIGATVGDEVDVLTAASRLSPLGLIPKSKKFRVTGIFNTGLYEFDSSTALISLESAQRFFGLKNRVSMLQIKIKDIFQASKIAVRVKQIVPPVAYVMTWM